MRRRIILIVVVLSVLLCLVVGIWWYVRQNTGAKLLTRAAVAMQAEKYDRAVQLAGRYIARRPDDWRGYYEKARAQIYMGRYAEARETLKLAAEREPDEPSIAMALADTYALPARQTIYSADARSDPQALARAIDQLHQSERILRAVKTSDPQAMLDVQELLGLTYNRLVDAHEFRAEALSQKVKVAQEARSQALAESSAEQLRKETQAARQVQAEAIRNLLAVVLKDPTRARAAEALIDRCIDARDDVTLAKIRDVIMGLDNPPADAAAKLVFHDAVGTVGQLNRDARNKKLQEALAALGRLAEKNPGNAQVQLLRARLAAMLGRFSKTVEICDAVLKDDPRHAVARFTKARALMALGQVEQAERLLFTLKTDFPRWAEAHFAYGQAAMALARKADRPELEQLAKEAFRTAATLNPEHAGARQALTTLLLQEQFYDQAFQDAQQYYEAHPDRPVAIVLMVSASLQTDQPELAREVLQRSVRDYSNRSDVLMAAAEGYTMLGDADAAIDAINKASMCKPDSLAQRRATARAWARLGADSERRGRILQAIQRYRNAVKWDADDESYRVALARVLLESGDVSEARKVLRDVGSTNVDAQSLRMQISLITGSSEVPQEVLLGKDQAPTSAAVAARLCLQNGRPQEAVKICLERLADNPDDVEARDVLGMAYLYLGRADECVEQWRHVLAAHPSSWGVYQRLADVLSRIRGIDQARQELLTIKGARADLVELAVGWLYARGGNYPAAIAAYDGLVRDQAAPRGSRNQALLNLAVARAAVGDTEAALSDLDRLARDPGWRIRALTAKADILISAGRGEDTTAVLAELRGLASASQDAALLRVLAELFVRIGKIDQALQICDEYEKLSPGQYAPWLLRGAVLYAAGRSQQCLEALQKAIDSAPQRVDTYLTASRTLEALNLPARALEILDRLEALNETAGLYAALERGGLYLRWGLPGPALGQFRRLAEAGYEGNPSVRFGAATALSRLGRRDEAAKQLEGISVYARQYMQAQKMLMELADTLEQKLEILQRLSAAKPGDMATLLAQMRLLRRADRADEAVELFNKFVKMYVRGGSIPSQAALEVLRTMLRADDVDGAAGLARRMLAENPTARWQGIAALIALNDSPRAALKVLGDARQAEPVCSLIGLSASVQAGRWEVWRSRIDELQAPGGERRRLPDDLSVLISVACGHADEASGKLAEFHGTEFVGPEAAKELVAAARDDTGICTEAARLIAASTAIDLGLPELAWRWAGNVLAQRPRSQWAAALMLRSIDRVEGCDKILERLEPKDCAVALRIRALLAGQNGDHAQAAKLLGAAVRREPANAALIREQAKALEADGRYARALELYRTAWRLGRDAIAANNAGYLVTRLYPEDREQLEQVDAWVGAVLETSPGVAAFADTKGWIAYLLGRRDEARLLLWQAVKQLVNSPEVHYHVGVVESSLGNKQLSRWHFEAALALSQAKTQSGLELSESERQAVELAKKALVGQEAQEGT